MKNQPLTTLKKTLNKNSIVEEIIAKTMQELESAKKPQSQSRVWQDPKGYQYLGVWQNAALLRVLVRKFTLTLPLKSTLNHPYQPFEYRLKSQMDDKSHFKTNCTLTLDCFIN